MQRQREPGTIRPVSGGSAKAWPEADVTGVIAELAGASLQSDRRFAESFARQRAGRYYGPRRIFAELAQRGIDSGLVGT